MQYSELNIEKANRIYNVKSASIREKQANETKTFVKSLGKNGLDSSGPGIQSFARHLEDQIKERSELYVESLLTSIESNKLVNQNLESELGAALGVFFDKESSMAQNAIRQRCVRSRITEMAETFCRGFALGLSTIENVVADKLKIEIDNINQLIGNDHPSKSPSTDEGTTNVADVSKSFREKEMSPLSPKAKDPSKVFVVHGRNSTAKKAIFDFLRSIEIKPIEWSEAIALTAKASPYVGEILDVAFLEAQAVLVLLTGDDLARLGNRYSNGFEELTPQARPNVLFEAGLAFGRHPKRTILVQLGQIRNFSDIAGRHIIHMDDSPEKRQELISRLKIAGCDFDITHKKDWLKSGAFKDSISWPDKEMPDEKIQQKSEGLEDMQIEILKRLAQAEERGSTEVDEDYFLRVLNNSRTKIKFHLRYLEENEFIYGSFFDSPSLYQLAQRGREYLVRNDLI